MLPSVQRNDTISNKIDIFKNVNYIVDDKFIMRIGETSVGAKELLSEHDAECGIFITPCNPYSTKISDNENTKRLDSFKRFMHEANSIYYGRVGASVDNVWAEPSFFVIDPDESVKQYIMGLEQDAYVFVHKNGYVDLVLDKLTKV